MWPPALLTYFAQRIDEAFHHGGDVGKSEVTQGNPEYHCRKTFISFRAEHNLPLPSNYFLKNKPAIHS
jgi:hypothetical protein